MLSTSEMSGIKNTQFMNRSRHLPAVGDVITTPRFENILRNIFNVFLLEFKKQDDLNSKRYTNIENKINNLIGYSQFLVPNKNFTLTEVVQYLNDFYGQSNTKKCTEESVIEFMKEIKMIRMNNLPYSKFEKDHYIIFNFDSIMNNKYNITLTKSGMEYLIGKLEKFHYI